MPPVREGQLLVGPLFGEPMRVETVRAAAPGVWTVGLVGTRSERFQSVALREEEFAALRVVDRVPSFAGDASQLALGIQAWALGIAWEFDPYFGLSISRVDPLPHQLEAVYDYLLRLGRVRFLLADDAGAGKTIMSGLLIRELKLRGLAERVLIVAPANLTFQWQRELREKFDESFTVLRGGDIRDQFGANQWMEHRGVITSLDLAKRASIVPGLQQAHWDLVIVDEAHRMSAPSADHKSQRYLLGELLRDHCDHLLLLTATPHKGDPENFSLFLQLLDADAFADVASIRGAMDERRAPFYLRRTKEAMVHFPERQPDGTWAARPIFTKRIPRTVDFHIDGAEDDLYREVSAFVKRQSRLAAEEGDDPRSRAVGFLMALYQRRLASSTYALRRSMENRVRRLEEGLKRARRLAEQAPPDLPDPEEIEEMEEGERERFEELIEAVTLTANPDLVQQEMAELKGLAGQARAVEAAGAEAKRTRLDEVLRDEGFAGDRNKRLLLFTEFKDTLDYLVQTLTARGFTVGAIHGGMRPGKRDEPGSRLWAEQRFRDGETQILVATEAAGEGINLQVCNVLFNYDIPWNPNRLEQRMGRIHRYGQTRDCLIFNFVATNTIEGRVLARLLDRLDEIRKALDDDAVFNVVGEVLPAAHIDRVLRDYYAGRLGDADMEDRLLRDVKEDRFRAICQNALEGLATKKLNLAMLVERRARAQERRLVPETIARFLREAAPTVPFRLKPVGSLLHAFDPETTPASLRAHEAAEDRRIPPLAARYPRFTTDRGTADREKLEWVTPGHPLFEAIRRHALARAQEGAFATGACFYSVEHEHPFRLDFYRARVVDGLGKTVRERFVGVQVGTDAPHLCEPAVLGNLLPAPAPSELPEVALVPEAVEFLQEHALAPFLAEVKAERVAEVERVARHVQLSLGELIAREDASIGRLAEDAERGVEGAAGALKRAEDRCRALEAKRARRAVELERERSLSIQGVERLTTVLVLPHPDRDQPEVRNLRPDPETEGTAMRVVERYETDAGRHVRDVHKEDLGWDLTSLDTVSGELRLIEVKGFAGEGGDVMLTPNERRVAEDRRDCYWLYVVIRCASANPVVVPVQDPASRSWREVRKVDHYALSVRSIVEGAKPPA